MSKKRVVVTGMGIISPIGNTVSEYWTNLIAGKSGVDKITHFDVSQYPTQIAAVVKDFNPEQYVDKKEARRTTRFILMAIAASLDAVKDSGLEISKIADEV